MRRITQEVMREIADKIESPDYPDVSGWDSHEAPVFLDEGNVIFQCHSNDDAERVLYALMRLISTPLRRAE